MLKFQNLKVNENKKGSLEIVYLKVAYNISKILFVTSKHTWNILCVSIFVDLKANFYILLYFKSDV